MKSTINGCISFLQLLVILYTNLCDFELVLVVLDGSQNCVEAAVILPPMNAMFQGVVVILKQEEVEEEVIYDQKVEVCVETLVVGNQHYHTYWK